MKILYLADSAIPSRTANSVHVMKMCQAFSQSGNEVILVTPAFHRLRTENPVDIFKFYGVSQCFEVIQLPCLFFGIKKIPHLFVLLEIIRRYKPDLIYGRYLLACTVTALFGYATVFEAHGTVWKNSRLSKLVCKQMMKLKMLVGVVVISNALAGLFKSFFKTTLKPMFVAHDGADDPGNVMPCSSWRGRKNVLQVGYVGHLYEGRGIDIILDTARLVTDADFHCIGGTEHDIERWKKHSTLPNVHFYGHVPPSEVAAYRAACDVLLAPYQRKVMVSGGSIDTADFMSPLKIFEYMSSSRAIICSDLSVLREVLNEQNSLLVEPADPSAWAAALYKLQNNEMLRKQIALQAYSDFFNSYSWARRAELIACWVAQCTAVRGNRT